METLAGIFSTVLMLSLFSREIAVYFGPKHGLSYSLFLSNEGPKTLQNDESFLYSPLLSTALSQKILDRSNRPDIL